MTQERYEALTFAQQREANLNGQIFSQQANFNVRLRDFEQMAANAFNAQNVQFQTWLRNQNEECSHFQHTVCNLE